MREPSLTYDEFVALREIGRSSVTKAAPEVVDSLVKQGLVIRRVGGPICTLTGHAYLLKHDK